MDHDKIVKPLIGIVHFTQLPEPFLLLLFKRLGQEDVKSLRIVCFSLCKISKCANRLSSLKASALLTDNAPTLVRLPSISFLDFNARNAACSHQLLAALRQHGDRLEQSVRAVRLSGREGLLAALQTLRLACPRIERLEIRCQHSYRGRHKECADLGRCLQELETAFPLLTELHLQRFPISSAQLVSLCDSLHSLRALSIRGLAHALTSDSLAHLHRLSQLVSLSVDHLRLQDGCLACGSQLRSLELSDATISTRSFASLNGLAGLQSLSVWGTGHRAALAFAPLAGLTVLRRLHLELVLGATVLQGLQGCTALANLSATSARVLPSTALDDDVMNGRVDAAASAGPLPPQLCSVTRLSLESWSEDCLPLAVWLPGLRSLVLQEGDGVWSAVAGHEQLTSLRAMAGGSLPIAVDGRGAACCKAEAEASLGSKQRDVSAFPIIGSHEHVRVHHHLHHNHFSNLHHHAGPGGRSDSSHGTSGISYGGNSTAIVSGGSCGEDGEAVCFNGCLIDDQLVSDFGDHSLHWPSGANAGDSSQHAPRRSGSFDGATFGDEDEAKCEAETKRGFHPKAVATEDSDLQRSRSGGGASSYNRVSCQLLPPNLASLRLGGCEDIPEQHYFSCASMPALTACDLSGCGGLTTGALIRLLGAMPGLQELALEGAPCVTDQGLAALGLGCCPNMWTGSLVASGNGWGGGEHPSGHRITFDGMDTASLGTAVVPAPSAVACTPAVAAAAKAAATATDVPVPPCTACAGMVNGVKGGGVPPPPPGDPATAATRSVVAEPQRLLDKASDEAGAAMARCKSGAARAAVVEERNTGGFPTEGMAATAGGMTAAEAALRRLELTRLPSITACGVAAAAACLPRLTELRVASCQAVCREACVWLPQQLGRPYLSVVCSHAAVYDEA